jgi:GNAT superfamily N-acetyltransferase
MFRVELFCGDRSILLPLLAEADDSSAQIAGYVGLGEMLVARRGDQILGHLLLVCGTSGMEIKSLAVQAPERKRGVGAGLIAAAFDRARAAGISRMVVGVAAADVETLGFYQRRGFRMESVEREAFSPATGYPEFRS